LKHLFRCVSLVVIVLTAVAAPPPASAQDDALKIVGYEIVGNQNISDEVILLSIVSRVGDVYTKELVERDVEALKKLGYFFYINADAVPYKDGLKVVFKVYENPVINEVEIRGNTLVSTDEVKGCLQLEKGITLNLPQVHEAILKINKLYQDKGFSYCGVLSQEQVVVDKDTNNLVVTIAEPKLRNTSVEGNRKTKNYVILRQLEVKRGQIIKTEKLRRSLRNVFNLQYFEDVKPPRPRLSDDRDYLDLELTVKEQKTGQASFGGGYSSVNGVIGFIDVAETNFRGRGQTLRTKLQFGGEQRYQLDFLEPWFKGKPISMGASVFDMAYEREEIRDAVVQSRFEERRAGWSTRTGWRVGKDQNLSFRFTHEVLDVSAVQIPGTTTTVLPLDLQELDTDSDNEVKYLQQSINLTWTRDARDNRLNAKEGYRVALSASTTGGFLKGINGFQQYTMDWRKYHRMGGALGHFLGYRTIFAYRLKGGTTAMSDGTLRFVDRFSLGGGETLRGYADHEFTGDRFAYGNFEFRRDLAKAIGLAFFFDYGDAWGLDGLDSFDAKASYGVGLRLNTPIGPFRLDWGKPTDRSSRFHFGIGQQF